MKRQHKRFWLMLGLLLTSLPFSSCALFRMRMNAWEKEVTRDEQGVLDFAEEREIAGGDTALLLVHGYGDTPNVWAQMIPALAEAGFTVKAIRLPGWGEPIEVKQEVELEDWLEKIRSEATALHQQHEHVVVLAHSLGGGLSGLVALEGELEADALVLYAPLLRVSNKRSPLISARAWYNLGRVILPNSMVFDSIFQDHATHSTPRPKTERDPFVTKNIYEALYAAIDRFHVLPAKLQIPVRMVLAREDRVVNSEQAQAWFETLEAPVKLLVVEEEAGHVLPRELDPEQEAQDLKIWLSELGMAP